MTNGTSQGLFVVVGIIIFGIFVLISYILFKDTLKPTLSGIFTDSLEQSQDNLIGNITEENPTESVYFKTLPYGNEAFIYDYTGEETEITIPKEIDGKKITYISSTTFSDTKVTKVNFEKGFDGSHIFKSNFLYGSKIKELYLPDGAKVLDNLFGLNATNLEKVTLPNTLKEIKDSVFTNTKITEVYIPEGVTFLGYNAFTNKNLVQTFYLPNTLSRYDATIANHNMENTFVIGQYIEISTKYGEGLYIEQFGNNFKIIRQ
ncbi:leucine-rich repeat domain-containing protein [Enterococcus malodoratus]|uniref:leucine-rich repeat domain-containing protein n=1 Tax=Enterococcus malodoratus TaxID=71451 RepID=UPI0022E58954|nr:leucine-rich repeat domain-containing protein [Enterococcus malodoratus]